MNKLWAIEKEVLADISRKNNSFNSPGAFDFNGSGNEIYSASGGVANISVSGVLVENANPLLSLFGYDQTQYSDIISAINKANDDRSISSIVMSFNTPGGEASPMFEVADAIYSSAKKVTAVVKIAASAGYVLASQASKILLNGRAASVGSIGVVAEYYVDENTVSITSSNAPKKRPDIASEDGRAVVVEQLDKLHSLMVETIGRGRNKEPKTIDETFGQGAMIFFDDALAAGMVDGHFKSINKKTGVKLMSENLDIEAIKSAALERGQKDERSRVLAHLTLAEASGNLQQAIDSIKGGESINDLVIASHHAHKMKSDLAGARSVSAVEINAEAVDAGQADLNFVKSIFGE